MAIQLTQRTKSIANHPVTTFPATNPIQLKTDQAASRTFIAKKGFDLNIRDGGRSTGWVGIVLSALISSADNHKPTISEHEEEMFEEASSILYPLFSIPGKIIGFVTSPLRIGQMSVTRKVIYTSDQVNYICDVLQVIEPTLKQDSKDFSEINAQKFKTALKTIKKEYGKPRWIGASNRSSTLIKNLKTNSCKEIIHYLQETEEPFTGNLKKWVGSDACKINQGKRLFNIIMGVMKTTFSSLS